MTLQDIAQMRLSTQQIAGSNCQSPADVVKKLCAIQAQDYLGSLWAIGLRLPESTEQDIEQAIIQKTIIRTWPMRGTLHFVTAEDARWMLALLGPRIIQRVGNRLRQFAIDEKTIEKSKELFSVALHGAKQITRNDMYHILEHAGIQTKEQRGLHILIRLSLEGFLCFGPRQNKQQTFALFDDWIPKTKPIDRDESLQKLAIRYIAGHGPATIQDFVWWSSLTVSEAKKGIEMAASQLQSHNVDGQTYWTTREIIMPQIDQKKAYLLPPFDEFLVAYKNRTASLNLEYATHINPGANGIFYPAIAVNGKIIGTWKRTIKKDSVIIQANAFTTFSSQEKTALTEAIKPYGAFLNLPAVLAEV